MSIRVRTTTDLNRPDTYGTATGWKTDEDGTLHVIGPQGAGNLASYPRGEWIAVLRAEVDSKVSVALDGKAIHEALLKHQRTTGAPLGLA